MNPIVCIVRQSFAALLLILSMAVAPAAGQNRYEQIALRYDRPTLYHEAIVLPGAASAQVVVAFRIPHSLLVFVQDGDGFLAHAEVSIELFGRGSKVDEKIWKGEKRASTFAETSSNVRDLTGRVLFHLSPGAYAYRVTLADGRARAGAHPRRFQVPDFEAGGLGPPFFAHHGSTDSADFSLEPAILGDSAPFGSPIPVAIPLTFNGRNPVLEYRLYMRGDVRTLGGEARTSAYAAAGDGRMGRREAEPPETGGETIELTGDDRLLTSGSVALTSLVPIGSIRTDCFCWSINRSGDSARSGAVGNSPVSVGDTSGADGNRSDTVGDASGAVENRSDTVGDASVAVGNPWRESGPFGKLAFLDLHTDSLESGTYVLDLMLQTDEDTLRQRTRFSTLWRDMPLSLYDVEVAIRNLSFIESRDRIREMLNGSRADRIEAFRAYWKQRDPSPGTVVNELMQEYYERIDLAASKFRTGRTPYPDGLRTDAARVFVVQGPPEDISSSFPSTGGVQQVWTYADGRQFVFWAASSLDPLELEESNLGPNGGPRSDL